VCSDGGRVHQIFSGMVGVGEQVFEVEKALPSGAYLVVFAIRDKIVVRKVVKK